MEQKRSISTNIDLHMHSAISDGTESPAQLLSRVRKAGLSSFSLTDHDAYKGCGEIMSSLTPSDPLFVTGVELSCTDEAGKYHILGYGFDLGAQSLRTMIRQEHEKRMGKNRRILTRLNEQFGIRFPESELKRFFSLENPGKPHIGELMVRHHFAVTLEQAFRDYLNKIYETAEDIRPEKAIEGILSGGGIPVLAHPLLGDGRQLIAGEEMDVRLRHLMEFGLKGLEAFYFDFTKEQSKEMLDLAQRYDLYVTAGSDYHGGIKKNRLGCTGLETMPQMPEGMKRFFEDVGFSRNSRETMV